jgi:hypothetical protein
MAHPEGRDGDRFAELEFLTGYTAAPYSSISDRRNREPVGYESQASALPSEDERVAMEFHIACAPEEHPVIPGTGGFRKARGAGRI